MADNIVRGNAITDGAIKDSHVADDADIALSKLSDSDTLIRINATDYSIGDSVTILEGAGGHTIQNDGTDLTDRDNLNFTGGLTATDDSVNDQSDISISDGGVDTDQLADDAVTNAKMAVNSVDSDQYVDASIDHIHLGTCLLYTSPSPRDRTRSRMPSSA